MSNDNTANITVDGNVSPLRQKLREAGNYFKEFGAGAEVATGRIGIAVTKLQASFAALGVAISAGAMVAFTKQAIDAADNLGKLSQKIGISVEDLAGLDHAAKLSDISTDQLGNGVKQLSRFMGEYGDRLKAAGITATDAKGVLLQVADAFAQMPDGVKKTAIAMEIFGKSGADMIPLLNGGAASIREVMAEGQRLNPVTAELAKNAETYNDTMTRLRSTLGGVGVAIANDVLPPLISLTGRLQQATAPGLIEGFKTRWMAAFKGMAAGINEMLAASEEFLAKITFGKVAENHLKQALAYRDAAKRIYVEMAALSPPPAAAAPKDTSPPAKTNLSSLLGPASKGEKDKGTTDPSRMATYEAVLAAKKNAFEQENVLRQFSKEQELAYWRELTQAYTLSSGDQLAIARKTATLELEIRRQSAKEKRDLDAVEIESRRAAALALIQTDEQRATFARENGAITQRELIALEEEFARRRYEIESQAVADRIVLTENDPSQNAAALAQLNARKLELERDYHLRRGELQQQSVVESEAIWRSFTDTIAGLWDKGINALMNGTLTWSNAFRAIGAEMVSWFATNVVGKEVKEWIAGKAKMLAVKLGFAQANEAIETASAAKAVTTATTSAAPIVGANAAKAGSEAAGAVAGIPGVGPWMAMAAMAMVFAGVMGLLNRKSAAGGYDIPHGINPLTQLHEEEMVLPQKYANVIRGMAAGGAAEAGGGGDVHIHARSDADVVRVGDMKKLLRSMKRNFVDVK